MITAGLTVAGCWGMSAWALRAWGRDQRPPVAEVDAIVVLGCHVQADGTPSPALVRRVRQAVHLFHGGHAPRMILSGGAHPGRPAEAEVADRLAARLGVPQDARVLETASLSTADNARLCAPLVSGPIIVVTDDYHLFRAIRHFQRHLAYPVYGAASWSEGVKMPLREVPAALWTAARS